MRRWMDRRRAAPDGGSGVSAPRRVAARERAPGPAEIRGVLECACKDATPAVVLAHDDGFVLRGRFAALQGSRVTLALDPSEAKPAIRPLSVCSVSFAHDERAYVFLAPVWRLREGNDGAGRRLLSLGLPGQMASLDAGAARRIPVGMGVTLSIEVGTYDRRTWSPDAVDVSASGVLLDFGEETPPRLPVGALVEIALELEGRRAALTAAVRRREEGRLALSFVVAEGGSAAEPSEALREMLSLLERRWLESSHA